MVSRTAKIKEDLNSKDLLLHKPKQEGLAVLELSDLEAGKINHKDLKRPCPCKGWSFSVSYTRKVFSRTTWVGSMPDSQKKNQGPPKDSGYS